MLLHFIVTVYVIKFNSNSNWMKMVNFKLGNKVWKVNWSTWHNCGTKKKSESWHIPFDQLTFHISLSSLKFTIFIHLSLHTMTLMVLFLTECRMPVTWTQLNDLTLHTMSSHSSVDRVPAMCLGGHGFDSCQGLRFFLCATQMSGWSIHLS